MRIRLHQQLHGFDLVGIIGYSLLSIVWKLVKHDVAQIMTILTVINPESSIMPQAIWNGTVIAESDNTETVEGNVYFPHDAIHAEYFQKSEATTFCAWKGNANYYDVVVDGRTNEQAAWYYANPKPEANNIKGFVAFWKGIEIK